MKVFTFHRDTAETKRKYKKKEAWLHLPTNETQFKRKPYLEINLEQTPSKNTITSIHITLDELEKLIRW